MPEVKMLLPLRVIEFEFNLEYTVMRTNMKFERHKKAAALAFEGMKFQQIIFHLNKTEKNHKERLKAYEFIDHSVLRSLLFSCPHSLSIF
jgi:D-mannonate dehydratase